MSASATDRRASVRRCRRGAARAVVVALALLSGPAALAQVAGPPAAVPLYGARTFDMTSKVTGRTYRIFVYLPSKPPPPSGYPVVTVTDGNFAFPVAAATAALRELGGAPTVVVGVGYPIDAPQGALALRSRDLTPATPLARLPHEPGQPAPRPEDYGGAELFFRFLTEELRPAIAAAYPVNGANQALYGHSFGGLFTLGVLFAHPAAFRTYIVSSPSIWWNDKAVLAGEPAFARQIEAGATTPRVLILVGGREQAAPDVSPPGMTRSALERIAASTRMVDNAHGLANALERLHGAAGWRVAFHMFEGEDHISVIPASISRALAFAAAP